MTLLCLLLYIINPLLCPSGVSFLGKLNYQIGRICWDGAEACHSSPSRKYDLEPKLAQRFTWLMSKPWRKTPISKGGAWRHKSFVLWLWSGAARAAPVTVPKFIGVTWVTSRGWAVRVPSRKQQSPDKEGSGSGVKQTPEFESQFLGGPWQMT